MRRAKWAAFCFLLGLFVVSAPNHSPAQFGGKGGKGKGGFGGGDTGGGGFPGGGGMQPGGGGGFPTRGGGGFPGGGGGFPGGGNIQPGGGGFPGGGGGFPNRQGGGGFPGGGGGGFPGGNVQPGGGGGGGFPGGGGGFPGGGGGGGFPGGGRGGFNDPEQSWIRIAGNSDSIDLSKIDQRIRDGSRRMAERFGTEPLPESGIMTKAQYLEFSARNTAKISATNQGGGPGGPGGPPMPGGQITLSPNGQGGMNFNFGGGGGGPGGGRGPGGGNPDETAAKRMREQDRDQDGKVSRAEADNKLQPNFDRIDADSDGYITMDEYRAYYANQGGGRGPGGGQGGPGGPGGNWNGDWSNWNQQDPRRGAEEEKPVALRYGHLPKELPNLYPWFDEDDADKDGQVALHEWRRAGKDLKDFQKMDLNGDGLITADELLRFGRKEVEDARIAALMNPDAPAVRPSGFAGGQRNGGGFALPGSTPPSTDVRSGPNNYGNGGDRQPGKGGGPPGKGGKGDKGDKGDSAGDGGGNDKGGPNPFRDGGGSGGPPQRKGKG